MTHLDTSFLIDLMREKKRDRVGPARTLLGALHDEPLAMSLFARCELESGAERATDPVRERRQIADVCQGVWVVYPNEDFASLYGRTLAQLLRKGRDPGTMDLLIACAALAEEATLVTGNRKHFEHIPGLRIRSY